MATLAWPFPSENILSSSPWSSVVCCTPGWTSFCLTRQNALDLPGLILSWFSEQLATIQFWNVLLSRTARLFFLSDTLAFIGSGT